MLALVMEIEILVLDPRHICLPTMRLALLMDSVKNLTSETFRSYASFTGFSYPFWSTKFTIVCSPYKETCS